MSRITLINALRARVETLAPFEVARKTSCGGGYVFYEELVELV